MAQTIELADLQKKQDELRAGAEKLATLNDGDRIMAEGKVLQRKGEELQAMALVYEAQQKAKYPSTPTLPPSIVRVELTDDQRKHVLEETGVRLEVVELDEGHDVLAAQMPEEHPGIIEVRAIEKARKLKLQKEADEAAFKNANAAAEEIAKQNNPDLNKILAEKMKDPTFLAGILQKK